MLQTNKEIQEFKTVHFCGGIGGCSLGMQQSEYEYKGIKGRYRTLYSIDVDPGACKAYELMTGSKAINADMFSREQYTLFHGQEPPADWHELSAEDLRTWANGEYPDVIFISAPCKGFSRLLPNAAAQKPKYQALNKLAVRAMYLAMEAWGDDPPAVIMFENVPGIETRGAHVLREIRSILSLYGYVFHEGHHDCGEIGQLGQKRVRYLMIARNPKKLQSFIYQATEVQAQNNWRYPRAFANARRHRAWREDAQDPKPCMANMGAAGSHPFRQRLASLKGPEPYASKRDVPHHPMGHHINDRHSGGDCTRQRKQHIYC